MKTKIQDSCAERNYSLQWGISVVRIAFIVKDWARGMDPLMKKVWGNNVERDNKTCWTIILRISVLNTSLWWYKIQICWGCTRNITNESGKVRRKLTHKKLLQILKLHDENMPERLQKIFLHLIRVSYEIAFRGQPTVWRVFSKRGV